ncbi:hypothetical protein [Paenibacillus sp. y28]|uniref:hypothetical protein n=1 Tax=Paenibacillus sp. y28 TaxID=3129110 RepID=UPI00301A8CDE
MYEPWFRADPQAHRVYSITLGRTHAPYVLILDEDRNTYTTYVRIMQQHPLTGQWHIVYTHQMDNAVGVQFYNRRWNLTGTPVLVLYSMGIGSGAFLTYEVLGEERGAIRTYVKENDIFQGSVFFEGTRLIQGSGNQFKVWEKLGGEFVLAPYQLPIYPGATVIRYSIPNENTVRIAKTRYTVPIGGVVQLVREDQKPVSERVLTSSDPACIEYMGISLFRVPCRTNVSITIIPGGYNWEGAKEITVVTKEPAGRDKPVA